MQRNGKWQCARFLVGFVYGIFLTEIPAGLWQASSGVGSISDSGNSKDTWSETGNYWPSAPGQTISGTFADSGSDYATYTYTDAVSYSGGQWSESGTGSVHEWGNSQYSYSGSGSYVDSSGIGSQQEQGQGSGSYDSTVGYSLASDLWRATSGSGSAWGNASSDWSFSASGGTASSPINEDGADHYDPYYNELYQLDQSGNWQLSGTFGSGDGASGSGYTHWSQSSSGSAVASGEGWSVSGEFEEGQTTDLTYQYNGQGSLGSGNWSYSGTGWISNGAGSTYSYSGTGTYSSGETAGYSRGDNASSTCTTNYNLTSGGTWQAASIRSESSGSGFTNLSYASSNSDYTDNDALQVWSVSGTSWSGGGIDTSYNYDMIRTYSGSSWSSYSGYSSQSFGTFTNSSYSASGSYWRDLGEGTISGVVSENGSDESSLTQTTQYALNSDGSWSAPTTSIRSVDTGDDDWSYSGSGSYSWTSEGSVSGSAQKSGEVHRSTRCDGTCTLGTDGIWSMSGGGTVSTVTSSQYSYGGSGSGSYSGYNESGGWKACDGGNGSYSSQHIEYWSPVAGGGWTPTSATDSASGTSDSYFSYNSHEVQVFGDIINVTDHANTTDQQNKLTEQITYQPDSSLGYLTWDAVSGRSLETTIGHGHTDNCFNTNSGPSGNDIEDEYGCGPGGCQEQTLTTYGLDGETTTAISNIVEGSSWSYEGSGWSGTSSSGSYGPSSSANFGYYSGYSNGYWYTHGDPFSGMPPMTGYSGGLSPSSVHDQEPGSTANSQSQCQLQGEGFGSFGVTSAEGNGFLSGAASDGASLVGSPSTLFQPTRNGGPSFQQYLASSGSSDGNSDGNSNYDAAGRLTSLTDANGGVTSFTYDSAGNLASLTDPVGNTTTWTYDAQNRMTQETDQLGNSRHFSYDSAGDLSDYTDGNGQIRQYQYDTNGNVAGETWYANADDAAAGQNAENTIQYTRDSAGRITSESDNNSSDTYEYIRKATS